MTIVCVDAGGTFTDFVVISETGVRTFKVRSTPGNPAQAVLEGLSQLHTEFELRHGTTVATNAILEGKFAKTAFITNEGFRDLLFLARQTRPSLYDLEPCVPLPPVSRSDCFGIPGRLSPDGSESQELDLTRLPDLSAFDAISVCSLFSFANDSHERAIASALPQGKFVSLSYEVSPEFREYERASTTTLNAAIGPRVSSYLQELDDSSGARSIGVMSSSGGLIEAEEAIPFPIRTSTSGPAAGVVAAAHLGEELGMARLIAFDMGGTSTDVTLIDGAPTLTSQSEIAGLPIRQNRIDVHTVGCGGGSIAWLDTAGVLQVGPQSAGADPGPALYGSGSDFTVTDANYLLGRIDAASLAGGSIVIDSDAPARSAATLANKLGCSIEEFANAVVERAESAMAAAIRKVSSARGHDPAEFALLAYGGAGGMHACSMAEELGITQVVVPAGAGVFSAIGLAISPWSWETWRSVVGGTHDWETVFNDLEEAARDKLGKLPNRVLRTADFRYHGQSHELTVPADRSHKVAEQSFVAAHMRRFGVEFPDVDVEWVCARVRVECDSPYDFPRIESPFPGEVVGPVVLTFADSTTCVNAGWSGVSRDGLALILSRDER